MINEPKSEACCGYGSLEIVLSFSMVHYATVDTVSIM